MPLYFNSKQVRGINYIQYNGKSYFRTGKVLPKDSTTTTPVSDVDFFYVSSCSAVELGEQVVNPGGSVTVPSSAVEFQLKFTGDMPGDMGDLILEAAPGQTCTIALSVNALSALVFDGHETGVPSPHEFVAYPSSFDYSDCFGNNWLVTYAARGSYYLTFKTLGLSYFRCGEAPVDMNTIYRIGSDSRTGLGGQVHADPDDPTSPGYSAKYKTLNYGFDSQAGTVALPILLQDVPKIGENIQIYMTGTGGGADWFFDQTGETINIGSWGLSSTAGAFTNGGRPWIVMSFPADAYNVDASLVVDDTTRVCLAGTASATDTNFGDKYFTIIKEELTTHEINSSAHVLNVENDNELFIKYNQPGVSSATTLTLLTSPDKSCDITLEPAPGGDGLLFDTSGVGSGPLHFVLFPSTMSFTDCNNNQYNVTVTSFEN